MSVILAFHAHPDDVETLAAGTLALLAANGHRIVIVTATAGDCGSAEHSPEETAEIRKGEAARAAGMIGADYDCAGFGDLAVFNDDASRRRVTELIRRSAADLVITAAPADYHPDHEAISALVRDACFAASAPNYRTGPSAPLPAIPHLYFTDPIGGRDRDGRPVPPDFGVDIGGQLEPSWPRVRRRERGGIPPIPQHALSARPAAAGPGRRGFAQTGLRIRPRPARR
jgi:LmbE family N-acetylglucosaminyl deacetylase